MMRRVLLLLIGLLLVAGPAAAASSRAPDELSIGVTQFPSTLSPVIDQMFVKDYVLGALVRPLVTYNADWKLECMLCTELPSFENGRAQKVDLGDGKTGVAITFTLLPDARWGDGKPVTTEDVAFSYKVGQTPQVGVADAESYRRIMKVDIKDEKTFTLTLDRITFDYPIAAAVPILPAHLEKAAFADPAQYRFRTLYDTDPTNPGLYDGPYRVTEIVPGSHIILERNPGWSGPQPYFRRIVIWTVENTAALEANLLAGGLDMVAGELGFSLDEALAFEKRHGSRFKILYKPGLSFEHIDTNLDNPILADLRVRQALLYGVDRKAITRTALRRPRSRRRQFRATARPGLYAGRAALPLRSRQSPRAARRRRLAARRRRHPAQGRQAAIAGARDNLRQPHARDDRAGAAGQWRQIGIAIRIKNQPARVLIGDTTKHRNFDMAMFAWVSAPENVPRAELSSHQIPSAENGWSGQNFAGYSNPDFDKLMDAIEVELDPAKRFEMWRQLQTLYAEELPALPLYFRADAFVLPKWLDGVTPTGHDAPSTLWIDKWHRTDQQAQK